MRVREKNTIFTYNLYCRRLGDPNQHYGNVLCIALDNTDFILDLKKNNNVVVISDTFSPLNDYTYEDRKDRTKYLKTLTIEFDKIFKHPSLNTGFDLFDFIKPGDVLESIECPSEKCTVVDDKNMVEYNGEKMSISTFAIRTAKKIYKRADGWHSVRKVGMVESLHEMRKKILSH